MQPISQSVDLETIDVKTAYIDVKTILYNYVRMRNQRCVPHSIKNTKVWKH